MTMRLLRATAICAGIIFLIGATFVALVVAALWADPRGDSGAIQGFLLMAVAGALSLLGLLLMPWIARKLLRAGRFTRREWGRRFIRTIFFAVAFISACLTIFLGGVRDGFFLDWLTLTAILLLMLSMLTGPIAVLWLWLAGQPSFPINEQNMV
jgi:hypothetical protein